GPACGAHGGDRAPRVPRGAGVECGRGPRHRRTRRGVRPRATPAAPQARARRDRDAVSTAELALPHLHRGKVRDLYAVGDDALLLVASDRLSAFDVVMDEPIPDKGRVLTAMTEFF